MDLSVAGKKIEDLLGKKSLSKKEKEDIASLLWSEYCETQNIQRFSTYILKSPSSVVKLIFQKILTGVNRISISDFVSSIKNDPSFLENKNNKSFLLACTVYSLFYKDESNKKCVYELFTKALMVADKNKEFSVTCLNSFKETIIADAKCKEHFFSAFWERPDKTCIYKFIKNLERKNYIDLTTQDMKKWIDDNQFEKPDRLIVIEETLKNVMKLIKDDNILQLIIQIQNNVTELKNESEKRNKKENDLYRSLDYSEKENSQLKHSLSRKESECSSLIEETARKSEKILFQEKRVFDLESTLNKFSQTANDSKSDEIFTLKNDIYLALRNEYERYVETKESACSEDLFVAYKSRFFRIFATLKRFGIKFEEGD